MIDQTSYVVSPERNIPDVRWLAGLVRTDGPVHMADKQHDTATAPDELGKVVPRLELVDTYRTQWKSMATWRDGADVVLAVLYTSEPVLHLSIASPDLERLDALSAEIAGALAPAVVVPKDEVSVRFWFSTSQGPQSVTRDLAAPTWDAIADNYASTARRALSGLTMLDPENARGRLMLLHGEPGTGKTTAIRALARGWKQWCKVDYVVDPERFFGDASYMISVILQAGELDKAGGAPWRLIVVEDAEEFVQPGSKHEVGQSVARLLNLCDGLIGQGLKILVLLTTNVPITALHPAMMRSGRCLANIAVTELSAQEATKWLGAPIGAMTLADLYGERESRRVLGNGLVATGSGTYL